MLMDLRSRVETRKTSIYGPYPRSDGPWVTQKSDPSTYSGAVHQPQLVLMTSKQPKASTKQILINEDYETSDL